jgi:hypothetical protein
LKTLKYSAIEKPIIPHLPDIGHFRGMVRGFHRFSRFLIGSIEMIGHQLY